MFVHSEKIKCLSTLSKGTEVNSLFEYNKEEKNIITVYTRVKSSLQ